MKKVRITQRCIICDALYEIQPSRYGVVVTCSKTCSITYREKRQAGRQITWGDKISAATKGKPKPVVWTDEMREARRQLAIKNGFGNVNKGRKLPPQHVENIRKANVGHSRSGWKMSEEICKKRHERAKRGSESHLWKGGITSENALIRCSHEYKVWRRAVFERDKFTCQCCGAKNVELNADHIKPFAYFKDLRFDVTNGRTLCVPCHKQTPTYLSGAQKLHGIHIKEV